MPEDYLGEIDAAAVVAILPSGSGSPERRRDELGSYGSVVVA